MGFVCRSEGWSWCAALTARFAQGECRNGNMQIFRSLLSSLVALCGNQQQLGLCIVHEELELVLEARWIQTVIQQSKKQTAGVQAGEVVPHQLVVGIERGSYGSRICDSQEGHNEVHLQCIERMQ